MKAAYATLTGKRLERYHLVELKAKLRCEIEGYAYNVSETIRNNFGFKGTKEELLTQLDNYIHTKFRVNHEPLRTADSVRDM